MKNLIIKRIDMSILERTIYKHIEKHGMRDATSLFTFIKYDVKKIMIKAAATLFLIYSLLLIWYTFFSFREYFNMTIITTVLILFETYFILRKLFLAYNVFKLTNKYEEEIHKILSNKLLAPENKKALLIRQIKNFCYNLSKKIEVRPIVVINTILAKNTRDLNILLS